jgi:hypothetical protein
MIVIDKDKTVAAEAPIIERLEDGSIRIVLEEEDIFIVNEDKLLYEIYDVDLPEPKTIEWRYVDGEFEEVIQEDLEEEL